MPNEGYLPRRAGSARFSPYYKLEEWDARRLAWRPVQKRFATETDALAVASPRIRTRLIRMTEAGAEILDELAPPTSPAEAADGAFRDWMQSVDRELLALCGLEVDELPDYGYRDAYEGGQAPAAVAADALEAAGLDFDGPTDV